MHRWIYGFSRSSPPPPWWAFLTSISVVAWGVERYRKARFACARRTTFGSAEGEAAISSRDNVAQRGNPPSAHRERLDSRGRSSAPPPTAVRPAGAGRSADRCPALTTPWPARSRDCRSQTDALGSRSHSSSSRRRAHPSRERARSNSRLPVALGGRQDLPRPSRGSSSRPAEPARRPRILPPRPSYWSSRASCTGTTPATRAPRRGPGGRGLSSSQTPVGTSGIDLTLTPIPAQNFKQCAVLSPSNPTTGPPGASDS